MDSRLVCPLPVYHKTISSFCPALAYTQALSDFFNNYEEELKQAGLREVAALELQLVVMDHIVDVFEGGVAVESEATGTSHNLITKCRPV